MLAEIKRQLNFIGERQGHRQFAIGDWPLIVGEGGSCGGGRQKSDSELDLGINILGPKALSLNRRNTV
ncbi:hypothetical protein ACN42_g8569 [Penicillium freii]|uniref:Uncharacterized protein n=1 Tax=Penicillium freii TaxID=48697 RepID=A0A101MDJ6_PENFR|nr:hypothetical protein ACN42_g8569 [Penicillium freii]